MNHFLLGGYPNPDPHYVGAEEEAKLVCEERERKGCPKCGGTAGRYRVETLKRENFESWGGVHLSYGDEIVTGATSWWRCIDCNAYKIPQERSALGEEV